MDYEQQLLDRGIMLHQELMRIIFFLQKKDFKQVLLEDKFVSSKLSEKEIDQALNPKNYLGTAIKQAERFAKAKA